jgi:Zn-dependent protease with chaperone function
MNPGLSRKLPFLFSLFVILTFASSSRAQGSLYENVNPKETGGLVVNIERDGGIRTVLSIPVKVDDPAALRQALLQSFNLPLTIDPPLNNPYLDDQYEEWGRKYPITLIEAHNSEAFVEQKLFSSLKIQPGPLAKELRSNGINTLIVTFIALKPMSNVSVSGAVKRGFPIYSFYQANINTDNPNPRTIDFSWGYQKGDIAIQSLPIALFLLAPLMLTLWMSRSVLKLKDRPAEMWGKYFRYLTGLINAIWILWFPVLAWSNMNEILPGLLGPAAGSYAGIARYGLWFTPPMLVMWLCHFLSHRVYRNVRGAEWSPGTVVRRAILGGSLAFVPLFGFMLGTSIWSVNLRNTALVMVVVMVVSLAVIGLAGKSLRLSIYSVTRGELRDRIFELASRAGVKLKQIYVLPDDKAQLSNAFARSDDAVMLTASLLRHLSKREVDAIMGHEIGHLKERHPHRKNTITMVTLIAAQIIATFLGSLINLQRWAPAMLSLAFAGATLVLHFISRGNERHADAIGIGLTGDPEAFISGLAKIEELNLMPMHAGGGIELGTHPQTLGRLQGIARMHGVSPERLQTLMAGREKAEEPYRVDEVNESQAKAFSTEFKRAYVLSNVLTILGTVVFAPILSVLLLSRLHLQGVMQFVAYLAGAVVTVLIFQVVRNFAMAWGFSSVEQRVRAKVSQQHLPEAAREGVFVGLAPSAQLRRYELCPFWDVGVLWFAGDQMFYLGEETSFVLNRRQIVDTRLAVMEPAPIPRNCLFIEWRDEARGSRGTFYVTATRPVLQTRREVFELEQRINAWLNQTGAASSAPGSSRELRSPFFGKITSEAAPARFQPLLVLKGMLKLSFVSCILSFLLRVPFWSACYAIALMFMLAIVDELPKLYFRGVNNKSDEEQPPAYQSGAWAESDAAAEAQQ